MLISIIIPVIRPEKAERCKNAIRENSGIPADQYEIIAEEDVHRIGAPKMVKRLTNKSRGQMVCFLGDDTIPQGGFLKYALEAMDTLPDDWGLVGLDDNIRLKGQIKAAAHWLADKRLLALLDGEFFHTGYKHCWCDNELTIRAAELGRYIFCEEAYVYHDHPIADINSDDADYRRVYSQDWLTHDVILFRQRRRNNWQTPERGIMGIMDRICTCDTIEQHESGGCLAGFKLAIGIPLSWSHVPSDFFDSILVMDKHDAEVIRCSCGPIHEMRNSITTRALELDCTHLIFLDADMVYPKDTITRLLAHDKDIIGALTFKRWPNFEPLVFVGEPFNMYLMDPIPDGVVKVTATGTGCLLIKTEVFENLDYPWFEFKSNGDKPVGEDINFCYNAGLSGYEVFVDTTIRTEHLCNTRVNWNLYQLNKKMIEQGVGKFNF